MSLNPAPIFDAVEAKVREIVGETPVYASKIPDDDNLPRDSFGTLLPYVAIFFGGPIRAAGDRSLSSYRRDGTILYFTVEFVAPTAKIARQLKGLMLDKLTGYRGVPDMSPLTISGWSMSTSRANNTVRPVQYVEMQSWQCRSNLISE